MIFLRPSEPADCEALAPHVRAVERQEVLDTTGLADMSAALSRSMQASSFCTSVVTKDHRVIALCGAAPFSPGVGVVWMLAAESCFTGSIGIRFLKNTKGWLNAVHRHYPILFNQVRNDNYLSIRWLHWSGFKFELGSRINNHQYLLFHKEYVSV